MATASVWPPWEVSSLRVKLDDLERLAVANTSDPEVLSWLSRMLVVRSSGFLEQTAKEVCRSHVQGRSGGMTRSFALSWLERSSNPSPENLLALVGRFDATLQAELEESFDRDDQRIRRELALLVDRRNKIAHGLNEGVTSKKARALKDVAVEVSDWLILKFNPSR